jgi:hypothetical protein
MDKHRDLEVSLKLFEYAETEHLRKAFRWVEEEFQFIDFDKYQAEAQNNSEVSEYPYAVTGFFEEVGFLVQKKFVEIDVVADHLSAHIISNWKRLEPWILAMRKEKGDKTFGFHFQKLYEKTLAYLRKN